MTRQWNLDSGFQSSKDSEFQTQDSRIALSCSRFLAQAKIPQAKLFLVVTFTNLEFITTSWRLISQRIPYDGLTKKTAPTLLV